MQLCRAPFVPRNENWDSAARRTDSKVRARISEAPVTRPAVPCGAFKIIASASCTRFVALETRWQGDMGKLTQVLDGYANGMERGIDKVYLSLIYACQERESGT